MIQVFISYSTPNKDTADQVCTYLEQQGAEVWIAPRNIKPGSNYPAQIMNAIKACSAVVLIASDQANASPHVINEISNGFDLGKTIIPFRVDHTDFSDEYKYYLGRKHWIDATVDFDSALSLLHQTLVTITGKNSPPVRSGEQSCALLAKIDDSVTTDQLIDHLVAQSARYSYSLLPRISTPEQAQFFEQQANRLFQYIVDLRINHTRKREANYIDFLLSALDRSDSRLFMRVLGNSGTGKNMVLQLLYYRLVRRLRQGDAKYIPFYISMAYYEKLTDRSDDVYRQIHTVMDLELEVVRELKRRFPDAIPVLFVDAVREHTIHKISPEAVFSDLMDGLGYCKRVVAMDVGLVQNRSRLKHSIAVLNGRSDFDLRINPIPLADEKNALEFISCVNTLYEYYFDVNDVFNTLKSLQFKSVDLFAVRLIIKELRRNYGETIYLSNMYEEMALREMGGKEEKLLRAAETIFHYNFTDRSLLEEGSYTGKEWSLVHKHNSFRDYMLAYYFIYNVKRHRPGEEIQFLEVVTTNETNAFIRAFLRQDYDLQEKLLHILTQEFDALSVPARCTCIYWVGRIEFQDMLTKAREFLEQVFEQTYQRVRTQKWLTRNNLDDHLLLRAAAYGLIRLKSGPVKEKYLLLLITNRAANLVNQTYFYLYSEGLFQYGNRESFLAAQDSPPVSPEALELLSKRLKSCFAGGGQDLELLMVSYMTLLQNCLLMSGSAEIHDTLPYAELGVKFLRYYKRSPQTVYLERVLLYLDGMADDLQSYLSAQGRLSIGQELYGRYHSMKDLKRGDWVQSQIEDPESLSEHTFSSWLLAMLFLPEASDIPDYSKQEILNMLLIHSMSESVALRAETDAVARGHGDSRDQYMKKLFLKGTYPSLANLEDFYTIWEHYEDSDNINSLIARDISRIQTIYSFCVYYTKYPDKFTEEDVEVWQAEKGRIRTETGCRILKQLVEDNPPFSDIFDMELVW